MGKTNISRNISKKINSIQILKYARDLFAYISIKMYIMFLQIIM